MRTSSNTLSLILDDTEAEQLLHDLDDIVIFTDITIKDLATSYPMFLKLKQTLDRELTNSE